MLLVRKTTTRKLTRMLTRTRRLTRLWRYVRAVDVAVMRRCPLLKDARECRWPVVARSLLLGELLWCASRKPSPMAFERAERSGAWL